MKRTVFMVCVIILSLCLVGLLGCAQKKVAQAPEQPVSGKPEAILEKPAETPATGEIPKESIGERPLSKGEAAEGQLSVEELQSKIQDIHFDYDKYDIRDDAKPVLKDVAAILTRNSAIKVIVEGHCDDRGTNEYNLALGERRARAAKDYLLSLGIPSSRIETISYGEEKPLCAESSEACWAKNRRAHFVLVRELR